MTTHKDWTKLREPTPIESFLMDIQSGKGNCKIISKLYDLFLSMNMHDAMNIKQKCETEMKEAIAGDT